MVVAALGGLALAALLAADPATTDAQLALASGEAHYARRALPHGSCDIPQLDAALADFRSAIASDAGSLRARVGFQRAAFIRGGFCDITDEAKVSLFEEAKRVAQESVKRVETAIAGKPKERRLEALRRDPLAAEIYLWAAVAWGQWSVDDKLAAAWQGAATRVRDLSQAVVDIEPETLDGAAFLILGRLHMEAPQIRFLTGWISRSLGIEYLRRGLAQAPDASNHLFFLGRALSTQGGGSLAEARRLLRQCATQEPRPAYPLEDRHYAQMARDLLGQLPAAGDEPAAGSGQ